MHALRILLAVHGGYLLLTGVWPLVHIESFIAVTGPKTDLWLVKTVGAALLPIAACMGAHLLWRPNDPRPVVVLGAFAAAVFIAIDFYYALTDVVADIYMLDGVVQIGLLLAWAYVAVRLRRERSDDHRLSECPDEGSR